MSIARRDVLKAGAAGSLALAGGAAAAFAAEPFQPKPLEAAPGGAGRRPRPVAIKVGAMDGIIGGGGAKALEVAKRAGLDGVEADAGWAEDVLRIAKPQVIEEYQKAAETTGVSVCSICMGLLNEFPLIADPRAPGWVSGVIDAAAKLKAKTILLACFGKGELKDRAAMEKAAAMAKELAPKAAEKGVTLGLENWLSASENLFILEKAGNPAGLKIYYDIGNSTKRGYDVPAEIRQLGDRIAQIHFKDYGNGVLGKGEIAMHRVAEAIRDIGFQGWIVLETGAPLGPELTAATNAGFVRGLFARWTGV